MLSVDLSGCAPHMQNMRHGKRSCCSELALMCVTVPTPISRLDRQSETQFSNVSCCAACLVPCCIHCLLHCSVGGCADLPPRALLRSRRLEGRRTEQIPNGASLCFVFSRGRRPGVSVYPNKLGGLQMEVKQYEGATRAVMLTYKNSSVNTSVIT